MIVKRDEHSTKLAELNEQINNHDDKNSDEVKSLVKQAQNEQAAVGDLNVAISEIDDLGKDQNITYTYNAKEGGFAARLSALRDQDGNLTININFVKGSDANAIHETAHAAQVMNGQLRPIFGRGLNGTSRFEARNQQRSLIPLEKRAYIRQFFFDSGSLPWLSITHYKQITNERVEEVNPNIERPVVR